MDLRPAFPYWLLRPGITRSYPSLDLSINTDIAIMLRLDWGNGIIFSVIAAGIICDILKGRKDQDAKIFASDR